MQPNNLYAPQPTPETPAPSPTQTLPDQPTVSATRKHRKLALTLLIAPTILWVLALVFAILSNVVAPAAQSPTNDALFSEPSALESTMKILSFLCSAVAFLTWLPGIIIGIILLNKK